MKNKLFGHTHVKGAAHAHKPSDRHPQTVKHLHWGLPIAAGVFGILVGLGVVLAYQQQRINTISALAPRHARIAKGEVLRTDLYNIKVTSEMRTVAQDPAFAVAADEDIVIVSMEITNRSDQEFGFFPSVHTYLRDNEGRSYMMHPTVMMKSPLPATDMKPGQTVKGELSYAVPARLKTFRMYVDPQWGDMAPAVFKLHR